MRFLSMTVFLVFISSILVRFCSPVYTTNDASYCHWFGDGKFQCHCDGEVACDSNTGACPAKCADGFFGPSCQYAMVDYGATAGTTMVDWLTDKDDTTCNDGSGQSITISLIEPSLLTWMRVVGVHSDGEILVAHNGGGVSTKCPDSQARVDDTTLDISCPTSEVVSELTVSGSGIGDLCSIYISSGRNVALTDTYTVQSTTHDIFNASYAVDGLVPTDSTSGAFCAITALNEPSLPASWRLTFPVHMNINRIDIYTSFVKVIDEPGQDSDPAPWIVAGIVSVLLVAAVVVIIILWRRGKQDRGKSDEQVNSNIGTPNVGTDQQSKPSNQGIVYKRRPESRQLYEEAKTYEEPTGEYNIYLDVDGHYVYPDLPVKENDSENPRPLTPDNIKTETGYESFSASA